MNTPPPTTPPADADRLEQLLADRAVFGLDRTEEAELETLLAAHGLDASADAAGYDRTAAAVFLAEASVEAEAMPASLRNRVLSEATAFEFGADNGTTRDRVVIGDRADSGPYAGANPRSLDLRSGVALALAASLLIAVGFSLLGAPEPVNLTALRAALAEQADDAVTIAWIDPADENAAALGDVVWSDRLQRGYMRFTGLPTNDPAIEQYQLWVFDAERDDRYPVDGGVFDIAADENATGGEVIVPIDVKLPVTKAAMFAVTIEKPGGVVVSDRSRLPLLAQR